MYCKECGQQIKEGDAFCGNCGTPVETKEAKQNEKKKGGKKSLGFLIICLIVFVCAGAGVGFFLYKPNDNRPKYTVRMEESAKDEKSTDETDEIEEIVEESENSSYASKYLKAYLDNSYKNDSSHLVSMKIATADEASEIYEEGLDDLVDEMLYGVYGLSDEEIGQWRQLFADILAGSEYTVGKSEEQDDGYYIVTVTCRKMKVYAPAMEVFMVLTDEKNREWDAAYANGEEIPSDEEMMVWAAMALKDCIADSLKNVTYGEEQTLTVKIRVEDSVCTPSMSDIGTLGKALFDSEAFY